MALSQTFINILIYLDSVSLAENIVGPGCQFCISLHFLFQEVVSAISELQLGSLRKCKNVFIRFTLYELFECNRNLITLITGKC